MLIHSASELKAILLPKSQEGVRKTQMQIYDIIDEVLMEFYNSYSPVEYQRTYQLLCSLVHSEIIATGNGYTAEVYFDVGSLGYKAGWSGEKTMANVAHGTRFTYPYHMGSPAIWDEPLAKIAPQAIQMLVANLQAAGIPIR